MNAKHDMEINHKINFKRESWKIIIISLLVFLPSISFIVIFYLNPNREIYVNNFETIQNFFSKSITPNLKIVEIYMWIGFTLVIFTLSLVGFFPFFLKKLIKKNVAKNILIIGILILTLMSIMFFATSQYHYSKFFNIFNFMIGLETDNLEVEKIVELFSENYNNGKIYGWSNNNMTWWVCFFQILFVTINLYLFLIKLNPDNIDKNSEDELNSKLFKKHVGQSGLQNFIAKISLNNVKSLSILLMILTFLIITPQFIFVISSSLSNSIVGSIYDWTFKAPHFFRSINPEFKSIVDFSVTKIFIIVYLPIIMTGFLVSSIVIFLLIYLRDLAISKKVFIIQLLVVFFESIIYIILNTVALSEINNLIKIWNGNDFKLLQLINNFSNTTIFNNAIFEHINTGISGLFIIGNRYIALSIISLSTIICVYVIHINKMFNFKKY